MTNNQIIPHVFEGSTIGTYEQDGQVWFIASDVARALGYRDAHDAVRSIDEDERSYSVVNTLGGPQRVLVINESGLFHLSFRCRKPAAKGFRRWITESVIPVIRKEAQRGSGVNAAEEREARRMGMRALRGRVTLSGSWPRHRLPSIGPGGSPFFQLGEPLILVAKVVIRG